MNKSGYIFLVFLFALASKSWAQSGGLLLYNMDRVPQTSQMNPAKFPKNTTSYFSFISGNLSAALPFTYNDALIRGSDDSLRINLSNLLTKLDDKNQLSASCNVQLFGVGHRFGDFFFNISASTRTSGSFEFSKDLVNFIVNGNADYTGQNIRLVKKGVGGASAWTEFSVGLGYQMNPKLSVSIKPKLLFGIYNIQTKNTHLDIFTEADGSSITANYRIDMQESSPDFENLAISDFFKNKGFAVDLGATYAVTNRFEIGASMIDLGSIRWARNNTHTKGTNPNGIFTFAGCNWDEMWKDGEFNTNFFNDFRDTLKTLFETESIKNAAAYRTPLPAKLFLSGSYNLTQKLKLNAVYKGEIYDKFFMSTLSLNANYYLNKWLEAGVGNTFVKHSMFNPSLSVSASLGGVFQVFGMVDFSNIYLTEMKSVSSHVGINLLFGNGGAKK